MPLRGKSSADAVQQLADRLPLGFKDSGNGDPMQAQFYLSFDAGDAMWEVEWVALDVARNFMVRAGTLEAVLEMALERSAR